MNVTDLGVYYVIFSDSRGAVAPKPIHRRVVMLSAVYLDDLDSLSGRSHAHSRAKREPFNQENHHLNG